MSGLYLERWACGAWVMCWLQESRAQQVALELELELLQEEQDRLRALEKKPGKGKKKKAKGKKKKQAAEKGGKDGKEDKGVCRVCVCVRESFSRSDLCVSKY
jgi:hypothetical protein